MATHPHDLAPPFAVALASIPTLSRPLLSRFVARAIERLDELELDPDLEDGNDAEGIDEREQEEGV